ncbi:MAG: hypothetical protein WC676_05335 [Candidatus Omnitrophota bacterium]
MKKINSIQAVAILATLISAATLFRRQFAIMFVLINFDTFVKESGKLITITGLIIDFLPVLIIVGSLGVFLRRPGSLLILKWCFIISLILNLWIGIIQCINFFILPSMENYIPPEGSVVRKANFVAPFIWSVVYGSFLYVVTRPKAKFFGIRAPEKDARD